MSTVIEVEQTSNYHHASRWPFTNNYTCVGPDGTRWQNSSVVTLRSNLRRAYGPVDLRVTDHRLADHRRMMGR